MNNLLPTDYATWLAGLKAHMGVSTYHTTPELPKEVTDLLPSIESLVAEFDVAPEADQIQDT